MREEKVRVKYMDCGHERTITQETVSRGDLKDLKCNKCKTKPKKGTVNPSPA